MTRYYWCVNCGYHGDFGFERHRNIKCQCCDYDELALYTEEEWKEDEKDKRHEEQKQDPYYKKMSNGKI